MVVKQILFLCTGNYYRSRYAEEYVRYQSHVKKLNIKADSKGIWPQINQLRNNGPISEHAVRQLKARNILFRPNQRYPNSVKSEDFFRYDEVIAVCHREHYPMMLQFHPEWADKIRYWDVEDIQVEDPATAIDRLTRHLDDWLNQHSNSN